MPTIRFLPDDVTVDVERNSTVLDAAQQHNIPLTSICGGNARCTTCRIVITSGADNTQPLTEKEQNVSNQLGFEPMIRLACQTHVCGDIDVRRLVLDKDDISLTEFACKKSQSLSVGVEHSVSILFADIRGFTSFSEKQLPYDVIHMLNRYFRIMGKVINDNNGAIHNYMGDGLMALFGVDSENNGEEDSVRAGLQMLEAMDDLNPYLLNVYDHELEIGIGIHCGDVVIGNVKDCGNSKMVIGDAVNLASRIESENKRTGTNLLVSEAIHASIKQNSKIGTQCSVELKGKTGKYNIYEVLALTD
jgi:adenylate cyclase